MAYIIIVGGIISGVVSSCCFAQWSVSEDKRFLQLTAPLAAVSIANLIVGLTILGY